jgi:hypothetical protein
MTVKTASGWLLTGASLFIVAIWVVFKALDVAFDNESCNGALSITAYISFFVLLP